MSLFVPAQVWCPHLLRSATWSIGQCVPDQTHAYLLAAVSAVKDAEEHVEAVAKEVMYPPRHLYSSGWKGKLYDLVVLKHRV